MYGCDSWTIKKLKNWCFWTVVLEKTLESPLDFKEIKPVNPKDNQSWILIGRTDAEANTLATWCEEPTHWKRVWCWEILKAGGEGDNRGWDGWMASLLNEYEFEQAPGDGEGQGSLECYSPWGLKELDTAEWLNNSNLTEEKTEVQKCSTSLGYTVGREWTWLGNGSI